jgi:hypothetical protein
MLKISHSRLTTSPNLGKVVVALGLAVAALKGVSRLQFFKSGRNRRHSRITDRSH